MNKILITGLAAILITGCVTVTNVNPSSSPSASPTPAVTPTPVVGNGTLQGKFTIGPLCPVEPCNISEEQKRQAYEARKIQVLMPDKTTLVKEFTADYRTETYSTALPDGRYFINVTNAGIGPFEMKEVIVEANKTTVLDIDIDTGIR